MYCLQPVAIVKKGDKYSVIDGQQRLTTLYLIYKYLIAENTPLTENTELFHYEYERDNNNERKNFLRGVMEKNDTNIDFFFMSQAYRAIKNWFDENKESKEEFKSLINESDKSKKSIQVIWYPVETEKEHEIFRNINSGKIQLTNCDLIKALLLKRNNGIANQEQIAAQFQEMERQFAEDRFWYMLKKTDVEPLKGQSRMDVLFNLVCGIKQEDYGNEPRSAFFMLSNEDADDVLSKWKEARDKFQRIKDLFDDPYSFHYIGFLVYCDEDVSDILNNHAKKNKKDFINSLKEKIKEHFKKHKTNKLEEYSYSDTKDALRRVFVMHNIETILQRYKNLHDKLELRFTYEYFPFDLLYKQKWDIEHIASQTDNKLKSTNDRAEWLEAISADFPDYKTCCEELKEKLSSKINNDEETTEEFNKLFADLVKKIEGDELPGEKKDGIGNLVLLDSGTNRSFKNSLFPRKRRIVLIASGLRSKQDEEFPESAHVPICTQQVYTKSYNKNSDVKLNCWGKNDYEAYLEDMKEKLSYYFSDDEENS